MTHTWHKTILEGEYICLADIAEQLDILFHEVGRMGNVNVVIHAELEGKKYGE